MLKVVVTPIYLSVVGDIDDVKVDCRQVLFFDTFEFGFNECFAVHRDQQVQALRLVPIGGYKEVVSQDLKLLGTAVNDVGVDL